MTPQSCRLPTEPAIEAALEMQLPCPGFLDNTAQISAWGRNFTGAMLVKGQNQRCCRDLRPKTGLCEIPGPTAPSVLKWGL